MKPEFFCCIGGELKDTIQGIFKCSRIFLYRAAQSQTIDDMLVDGFFNNADDIRVNDLIILYCPEESRAYTFAKVSSIINGVVKTKELDTPNLPENVSAFFNDVGYLTASDLATVAFTGNLSDLNDTTITNPATGEYLRWNGSKWINMAGGGGGSAVWGSVGGNIADQADLQAALADKANVDMDNLTSVGQNIANWSTNVTNCITEIPQDIKLELNAGVLTLKAGSKVYVPNGSGTFVEYVVPNDLSSTYTQGTTTQVFLFFDYDSLSNFRIRLVSETFSGSTAPTSYQNMVWYDTTNNIIKFTNDTGSTWTRQYSFPVCIATVGSSGFTSIDQVFNGFGYIGSTVFALPGVKGLIPNGRNADGTLNSTPYTINEVTTLTFSSSYTHNDVECGFLSGTTNTNYYTYNEPENFNYIGTTRTQRPMNCIVSVLNGTITKFNPKTVFHAVDYSDIVDDINDESPSKLTTVEWVKNKIMASVLGDLYPVGSIYIGTQGTCPLATLIPGSTWQQIQGRYLLASGTIAGTSEYAATGTYIAAGLPDIWFDFQAHNSYGTSNPATNGCITISGASSGVGWNGTSNTRTSYYFRPWMQSSIYAQSTTVRPTAYAVNVWRRTA